MDLCLQPHGQVVLQEALNMQFSKFREANSHCVYDCVCFRYVESWGAEKGQLYSHEKRQIYIIQFLQDRAMQ